MDLISLPRFWMSFIGKRVWKKENSHCRQRPVILQDPVLFLILLLVIFGCMSAILLSCTRLIRPGSKLGQQIKKIFLFPLFLLSVLFNVKASLRWQKLHRYKVGISFQNKIMRSLAVLRHFGGVISTYCTVSDEWA